jgi:polysaccharide pyruvyl transferase WcaK-like protein
MCVHCNKGVSNNLPTALVISFFISSNIGDLALSNSIANILINKKYSLVKCDFPTAQIVSDDSVILKKAEQPVRRNILWKLLRQIKLMCISCFGIMPVEKVNYYVQHRLCSAQWENIENHIKQADIVILAGGNMIMDIFPSWPIIFSNYCEIASKHNKRIAVLYVGAGPILYQQSKQIYRDALSKVSAISVRDPISRLLCEEMVSPKAVVESIDPIFSLPVDLYEHRMSSYKEMSSKSSIKIGVCVLGEECFLSNAIYVQYLNGMDALLSELANTKTNEIEFVLFSTEKTDYIAVHELQSKLSSRMNVSVAFPESVEDVILLYKEFCFLIGGRMHSLIFAQKCLLPFIGVAWQDKINGFGMITKSQNNIYDLHCLSVDTKLMGSRIHQNIGKVDRLRHMKQVNESLAGLVNKGLVFEYAR